MDTIRTVLAAHRDTLRPAIEAFGAAYSRARTAADILTCLQALADTVLAAEQIETAASEANKKLRHLLAGTMSETGGTRIETASGVWTTADLPPLVDITDPRAVSDEFMATPEPKNELYSFGRKPAPVQIEHSPAPPAITHDPQPPQQSTAEYLGDALPPDEPPPVPDPLVTLRDRLARCADRADVLKGGDGWGRTLAKAEAAGKALLVEAAKDMLADRLGAFSQSQPDDNLAAALDDIPVPSERYLDAG